MRQLWLFCLLLTFSSLVATQGPCIKNVDEVKQEGRRCLPYCSTKRPCPKKKATSCQCDGSCGFVCVPNDLTCPELNNPLHGSVHFPEGRGFQSLAIYDCDEDYELLGSDERICRGDGRWTGEEPVCVHEDTHCSPPNFQIKNAYPDIWPDRGEFYIHDQIQYKCENGYAPSRGDQSTTTCMQPNPPASPTWTPISLTCKPKECPYPDNIDNGYYEGSSFSFGAQIFYHCNPGFTLVGSSSRTCLADQEWSGSLPLCKVLTCPKPNDLVNGFLKYKSRDHGAILWNYCDTGYVLIGPEERECLSDGIWSGQEPTCSEVNCDEPVPPSNGKILHSNGTRINSVVEYQCDVDSLLSGAVKAICILDGSTPKWSSSAPVCLRHCEVLEVENGLVQHKLNEISEGGHVEHGVTVQVTCDPGYETSTASEASRCEDGVWVPPLNTCVPASCSHQSLSLNWLHQRNLEFIQPLQFYTPHGKKIQLQCNLLYPEMLMPASLTCNWGEWEYPENDGVRCIPRSCSLQHISLPHGSIYVDDEEIHPEEQKSVVHSTVLHFECSEPGYELYEEGKPVDYSYGSLRTCTNGTLLGYDVECRPGRCSCLLLHEAVKMKNMEAKLVCHENDLIEHNEKVPLKCLPGFTSTPSNKPFSVICHRSAWEIPLEQCELVQSNPESVNEQNYTTAPTEYVNYGTVEMTTVPSEEEFYIVKPPAKIADCKYIVRNDVLAYFEDSLVTRDSIFRAGTSLIFRCPDISYFSMSGKIKRLCRQGEWLGEAVSCTPLIERKIDSAPVITYAFIEGIGFVAENGALLVLEGSTIELSCLWYQENGNVTWMWKGLDVKGPDISLEWVSGDKHNLKIINIARRRSGLFTCTTPFKNTHGIHIKVSNDKEAFENAVKTVTTQTDVTTTEILNITQTSPRPDVTIIEKPVCFYPPPESTEISSLAAFLNGQRVNKRQFAHGTKLQFRCDNVFDYKLDGNRVVRCAKNEWIPQLPNCTQLEGHSWNSAPPLAVWIYQNKSSVKLTEIGEIIVPKHNILYLLCKFSLAPPIMTVKGVSVPIVKDYYNTDGETIWYLQMGPFDEMVSFTFTCQVPRQDANLFHSLIVRVGDTCLLSERKWKPLAVPRTLRQVYLEGDRVQLQCKNKRSVVPSYLTCSKGGVWINGPLLKCNQQAH